MKNKRAFPIGSTILFLSVLLLVSIVITSCMGAVRIAPYDTLRLLCYHLFGMFPENVSELLGTSIEAIVWKIRFPRILLGVAVGAGLSLCGVAMQATVQNPLAEPYILGISSGASLFATFSIMLGFGSVTFLNLSAVPFWAFLGALAASFLVLFLASAGSKITSAKLILSGAIINALCTAFSNFIITIAGSAEGMMDLKFWTMGSLARADWDNIWVPLFSVLLLFLLYLLTFRPMNTLLMGDEAAITLGINLGFYRKLYLITASFVTGILVATCGVIGFVGLVVPHVVRALVGADQRRLVPVSALFGSMFVQWADALARTLIYNAELPVGILTAFVGAPVFAWMLLKKNYSFSRE